MIRKDLFKDTPVANMYAFGLFILAKGCAMAGVALGWSAAYLYSWSLAFGLLRPVSCRYIRDMCSRNEAAKREAEADQDLLQKMVDDGSLSYLLLKKGVPAKKRKELLESLGLPDHCVVETASGAN